MRILAVVPAYNEEKSIRAVVSDLHKSAPNVDVLIVNDGSTDETAAICRNLPNCIFIDMPFNVGLADAVQTGLRYAAVHNYDCAVQFDGDGQHRAEYIEQLSKKSAEGYDIVIGSRFYSQKRPISLRTLGSVFIGAAIKLTSGLKVTDPTSGLRLYNKKILCEFASNMNYAPEPDTLAYLARNGATICEVQVVMDERTFGVSYFTLARSLKYMLHMCFSILLVQWFRKRGKG